MKFFVSDGKSALIPLFIYISAWYHRRKFLLIFVDSAFLNFNSVNLDSLLEKKEVIFYWYIIIIELVIDFWFSFFHISHIK